MIDPKNMSSWERAEYFTKQNDKVRQWCREQGWNMEYWSLGTAKTPSHFYTKNKITVEAASVDLIENVICRVKIEGERWQPQKSFKEFTDTIKKLQAEGYL